MQKVLIAYASNKGTTEDLSKGLATALAQKGITDVKLVNLKGPATSTIDLSKYDLVVLGAPVYAGNWPKAALSWAQKNEAALLAKPLAIFEVGMGTEEIAATRLVPSLAEHALAVAKPGGAIRWSKLNFFEKFIMKMITKKAGDSENLDKTAIEAFTETVAKAAKK